MKCDRCKQDAESTKWLKLISEEKETTLNFCLGCFEGARYTWKQFLHIKQQTQSLPALTDESAMYFGKYKGVKMKEVSAQYLIWLSKQPWVDDHPRLVRYINANLETLEEEVEREKT